MFQRCCFTNLYSVHMHSSLKVVNDSCLFPKQGYNDTAINIYLKWCYVVQVDVNFPRFKKKLLFSLICILWMQSVLQNLKMMTLILQYIFFMHYISGSKTSLRIFFMRFNEKKEGQNIVRIFIFMCHESIYSCSIYQRVSLVTKRELVLGIGKDHDL